MQNTKVVSHGLFGCFPHNGVRPQQKRHTKTDLDGSVGYSIANVFKMIPNAQFNELVGARCSFDSEDKAISESSNDIDLQLSTEVEHCGRLFSIAFKSINTVVENLNRRMFLLMYYDQILSSIIEIGCDPTAFSVQKLNIDELHILRLLSEHMNKLMRKFLSLFQLVKIDASVMTGARFGVVRADFTHTRYSFHKQKRSYSMSISRIRRCMKNILGTLSMIFSDSNSSCLDLASLDSNDSTDFEMVPLVDLFSLRNRAISAFGYFVNSLSHNNDSFSLLELNKKVQNVIHLSNCTEKLFDIITNQTKDVSLCKACKAFFSSLNAEISYIILLSNDKNQENIYELKRWLHSLVLKCREFERHIQTHEISSGEKEERISRVSNLSNVNELDSMNKTDTYKAGTNSLENKSVGTDVFMGEGTVASSYVPLQSNDDSFDLEHSKKYINIMIPELKERLGNIGKDNEKLDMDDKHDAVESSAVNHGKPVNDKHQIADIFSTEDGIASKLENLLTRKLRL